MQPASRSLLARRASGHRSVAGHGIEIFAPLADVDERDLALHGETRVARVGGIHDPVVLPSKDAGDDSTNLILRGEKENARTVTHVEVSERRCSRLRAQ